MASSSDIFGSVFTLLAGISVGILDVAVVGFLMRPDDVEEDEVFINKGTLASTGSLLTLTGSRFTAE